MNSSPSLSYYLTNTVLYNDREFLNMLRRPGLLNACKKKNVLYKHFLKCTTKEAEIKSINKLTTIMRSNKTYYNKLLGIHKSNTPRIWNVLNNVINKSKNKFDHSHYVVANNKQNVNAKHISDPIIKNGVSENNIGNSPNTIFFNKNGRE